MKDEKKWLVNPKNDSIVEVVDLRDQFAMAALTGLLANPGGKSIMVGDYAELSYEYADAMLKARAK